MHRKVRTLLNTMIMMVFVVVLSVGNASAQEASSTDKTTTEQKASDKKSTSKTPKQKKPNTRKLRKLEKEKAAKDTMPTMRRYEVIGGVLKEVGKPVLKDSVERAVIIPDSLANDTIPVDSLNKILSDKEQKKLAKELRDSTMTRHSRIFRDTIPISRMTAISLVAPGFSQLYNRQAWKIPVLYGVTGGLIYGAIKTNSSYKTYKRQYDALLRTNASQEEMNFPQCNMIRYNTYRQLFLAGAIASYIYFIGDGVLNYDGKTSPVKKATTLSTICPGAGQIYNKSYWKVPIVVGGFATMAYIIDFNNRGYQRFKLAYELLTDGDPNTVDEFNGRYQKEQLQTYIRSYRRNRDLSIICTAALYLLNIVDAHVDAHMRDYDISDNLAVNLEPTVSNFFSQKTGSQNTVGMSLCFRF